MSRYPLILILALAGAALLLTGMVNRPAPPASAVPAAQTNPAAEVSNPAQLLERAIAAFAPARILWADVKFWQQTQEDEAVFEISGRYLAAPNLRMRLELFTQVGATRGELKMVSDGQRLWQWQRIGTQEPGITLVDLSDLDPGKTAPAALAQARADGLRDRGFAGVSTLLRTLRTRLQQLHGKAMRWKGLDVIQVTGTWPEDPAKLAAVPEYIRPRMVPRQCSIYLDARTLWPHRIEWWYSERPENAPVLLMQTEFRDPILNRPLPPERCAKEFTIPQ